MSPENAFSHPFISKAVNELKCLRGSGATAGASTSNQQTSSGGAVGSGGVASGGSQGP